MQKSNESGNTPSKYELFIELAQPDENGFSRWVNDPGDYVGKYAALIHRNGWDWGRGSSRLAREYKIEVDRSVTPGGSIDRIRLVGFNNGDTFSQTIRKDIREHYKDMPCVMLGVSGTSENTRIEIDHKDGRKDDWRVSNHRRGRIQINALEERGRKPKPLQKHLFATPKPLLLAGCKVTLE